MTYAEVARGPGAGAGTPSERVTQAKPSEKDVGKSDNPSRMAEDLRRLRRESERPRRKNETLLKASSLFASRQPQE